MLIRSIDLTGAEDVADELRKHPLFKRRADAHQAFLDDLTRLTRKYGIEINITTRNEYGETYPEAELKRPYRKGTEARYVISDYNGIDFDSVKAKDCLPCPPEERAAFTAALAAREEEDTILGEIESRLRRANWEAWETSHKNHMEAMVKEYASRQPTKPTSFPCSCGEKFKTEARLKKHSDDTGHVT